MTHYYAQPYYRGGKDDERFGFLLPFVAGAAISAPFWFAAGQNRPIYPYPPYPPYPYPMYPPFPPYPINAPIIINTRPRRPYLY